MKTNRFFLILIFVCLTTNLIQAQSKPDALAMTPPMGWNSWNYFEERVSDQVVREIADAMASNGMKEAGYEYIIIDDYWVAGRDAKNKLIPDPKRFPHGMKSLADYVHLKGLKLGIYSDAAENTCGGVTASLNFEELDAKTFAEWGIDYLKYDYCNAPGDVTTAFVRYKKMGDALKASGRPIVFAICEWGQRKPWLWARAAGGHLWRTTWDSRDVWQSNDNDLTGVMEIFKQQEGLQQYAGPGGWNDPDMLMVGLYGKGKSSNIKGKPVGCTPTEYKTHFALWCMLAAPLIVNSDVRNPDPETLKLLTNKELVAIDQDALGKQGYTILKNEKIHVLKKELSNGDVAICIFNYTDKAVEGSVQLKKDLSIWEPFSSFTSPFSNEKVKATETISYTLAAHDCLVYRLIKK